MRKRPSCRKDATYYDPDCTWCYNKRQCEGPLNRWPGAYSYFSCPGSIAQGGTPTKGQFLECIYCTDKRFHYCKEP